MPVPSKGPRVQLNLRVPPELKVELEGRAREAGVSLNEYVADLLERPRFSDRPIGAAPFNGRTPREYQGLKPRKGWPSVTAKCSDHRPGVHSWGRSPCPNCGVK